MVETQTQTITQTTKNDDFSVIILLYKNPNFSNGFPKPFDLELCGEKMWKWVEMSCEGYQVKTTLCTQKSNVLDLIKPMLTKSKYTLVLYSDTPLIAPETIEEIFDYASKNDVDMIRLPRGFLFNTEFAKRTSKLPEKDVQTFDENSFFVIDDFDKFEFANQVLKNSILEYHEENGVCILDKQTTYIEIDCDIESGVIIYPNNSILGTSYIGKNTILKPNNVIISSNIGARCELNGAYVENAKIEDEKKVMAFERIIGK